MNRKTVMGALALMGSLAFLGCAMTPPPPPADTRVTIAADLADDVQVLALKCVRDPGGYLELQSKLLNRTSGECGVECRVVWLSADGLEIPSAVSGWSKRMLSPNDIAGMRNVAPSPDAVDFRFHVRRLRR